MICEGDIADIKFIIHIEIRKKLTWTTQLMKFSERLTTSIPPTKKKLTNGQNKSG